MIIRRNTAETLHPEAVRPTPFHSRTSAAGWADGTCKLTTGAAGALAGCGSGGGEAQWPNPPTASASRSHAPV